ncbi:hypothetical protein [Pacificoceanicola onchidii]|uniref:hypothetical protein n=1 Tax=Pacificoceanicola onchidii TaxID=2562685 RepID=UPI001455DE0B|nr:hypothetical protein [Pacificoceanicola onchidii]
MTEKRGKWAEDRRLRVLVRSPPRPDMTKASAKGVEMSWKIARRILLAGIAALTLAACALPGPQQAFAPGLNGLTEIATGVFSGDPAQAEEQLSAYEAGRKRAEAFHKGVAVVPDRTILCSTPACAERFGLKVAGLAYGHRLVLIGPEGLTPATLGHEFSRVAIARRIGARGMLRQSLPRWFDEGLAVWISPDPRYKAPKTVAEAEWITEAQSLRDWKNTVTRENWPHAYGSAGLLVATLAQEMGSDGLNTLIDAVANGAEFNEVFASKTVNPRVNPGN